MLSPDSLHHYHYYTLASSSVVGNEVVIHQHIQWTALTTFLHLQKLLSKILLQILLVDVLVLRIHGHPSINLRPQAFRIPMTAAKLAQAVGQLLQMKPCIQMHSVVMDSVTVRLLQTQLQEIIHWKHLPLLATTTMMKWKLHQSPSLQA
ncbi:unnamed protein product [Somion occarium]|uniref:Uncharacterized protein n=1 Tax=Somion occarium TaxID=3059160 RepID=A0ABP1E694_9APHY